MALSEDLELDVSRALASISTIEEALQAAVSSFGESLSASIDPGAISTRVSEAVSSGISAASGQPIEADAAPVTAAITEAVAAADATVEVDADVSAAQDAIDGLTGAAAPATEEANELSTAVAGVGSSAQSASSGLTGLANVGTITSGALSVAQLEGGKLLGTMGKIGPASAGTASALAALAAATGTYFTSALDADAATSRWNRTLGDLAPTVDQIDVGGLGISLSDLAVTLGSDDDAIRQVASSLFQLQVASGASRQAAAATTEQMIALAANAVALNPALGSIDQTLAGLSSGLARGGRFLGQYGIALNLKEITDRAVADTGKLADQLTVADKAAAGAAIATERLGTSMGTNVAEGAKEGAVQVKSFRQSVSEAVEAAGKPLLEPILEGIRGAGPALTGVARIIGAALSNVITVVSKTARPFLAVLGPAIGFVAKAVEAFSFGVRVLFGALEHVGRIVGRLVAPVFEFLGGVFDKVRDKLEPVIELVQKVIGFFVEGWGKIKAFAGVTDEAGDAAKGASGVMDALATTTSGAGDAADQTAQSVDDMASTITGAMPGLSGLLERFTADFTVGFRTLGDTLADFPSDAEFSLQDLGRALDHTVRANQNFWEDLGVITEKGGAGIAAVLAEQGVKQAGVLADELARATPKVVAEYDRRAKIIQGQEEAAGRLAGELHVKANRDAILAGFTAQLGEEQRFFDNLRIIIDRGGTTIAAELASQGPERGAAAAQAIAESTPEVLQSLETQGTQIKELEARVGRETASALVTGYATEIERSLDDIGLATASLSNTIKTGLQDALRSHSPSQWAMEQGRFFVQGFTSGITSALPTVRAAVGQLTTVTTVGTAGGVAVSGATTPSGLTPAARTAPVVAGDLVVQTTQLDPSATDISDAINRQLGWVASI